jgi:hypothetical protein
MFQQIKSNLERRRILKEKNFLNFLNFLHSGANVIKLFLPVIYRFSYKATVFVILDWKSLPMTNALVYYENP